MKDVDRGYATGPFHTEREVTMALGGDGSWRPTPRHPIEQTGKVREIDACNLSKINDLSNIWEKLQLPSANLAMVTGRRLQTLYTKKHNKKPRLRGIVFDESKAYRGIGVKFEHRKYSVVVVKNPEGGMSFFIMNSMMFGSNAAVPNYNRRAMLLTKILRVAFRIPLYNYFDDKFCLELKATSASALECITQCHRIWGILGVGFRLQTHGH